MIFTGSEYKSSREKYSYDDPNCCFRISPAGGLKEGLVGAYKGVFSRAIPSNYDCGMTLRRFESVAQAVFSAASNAFKQGSFDSGHESNLKEIVCAIVHWKMASQGGRANLNEINVRKKWSEETAEKLINAYHKKKIELFEIGGIRIPTASAILRFLYPREFGIIDSRTARITQKMKITSLNIREDGYISDTHNNRKEYLDKYVRLLNEEAKELNIAGILFNELDENGKVSSYNFRPCDVEMAMFSMKLL